MKGIKEQMKDEISAIKNEIAHMLKVIDDYEKSKCYSPDSGLLLYNISCRIEGIKRSLDNFEKISEAINEWTPIPSAQSHRGRKKKEEEE